MNELVNKYQDVLSEFNETSRPFIASIMEATVNYLNYKYSQENINFKITTCYMTATLYVDKNNIPSNELYDSIDAYKKFFDQNAIEYYSNDGDNDHNNYKLVNDFNEQYKK